MRIRKRLHGVYLLAVFMVFLCCTTVSHADNDVDIDELRERISEREDELGDMQSEKNELMAGRTNIRQVINGLESSKQEMSEYVTALDEQVGLIQAKIDDLNVQITAKEAEIEETYAELLESERIQQEQYDAMKLRIRFMYEQGDALYAELLFSASSFSDMLNKAEYIQSLSDYDRRKLDEYTLIVQEVQLTKELLESEEEVLEETRQAAEAEQEDLNTLIAEKEAQIAEFQAQIADQEEIAAAYDAEIAEQNRLIAEIEAQIAEDKEALEAAQRPQYNGGAFVFPAPQYKRVSSEFGYRIHPIFHTNRLHNGIDLAAPGGSPILAAADGKVVAAAYSSSMGNYVMIDHGGGLITIYMHASALYVSKGQMVSAGDKIAAVGSTGNSTGNHLHFTVRLNGEYQNPRNYLVFP